jgi:hypothetical protein
MNMQQGGRKKCTQNDKANDNLLLNWMIFYFMRQEQNFGKTEIDNKFSATSLLLRIAATSYLHFNDPLQFPAHSSTDYR